MIIYAVADIHGINERIERVHHMVTKHEPDLVIYAGDIDSFFTKSDVISKLEKIAVPAIAVKGNSDNKKIEACKFYRNKIKFLDEDLCYFNHFRIIGLGGTIPLPFLSIIGFNEKKKLKKIHPLTTRDSIIVTHPPPRNVLDKVAGKFHAGSINLRNFIKQHQPALLLCGHIHESAGHLKFHKTVVINCAMNENSSGAIIYFEKSRAPIVNMLLH